MYESNLVKTEKFQVNDIRANVCRKKIGPLKLIQGGRLAPTFFSPNYKCFDQFLQTFENKTTVLNLGFKEFLRTSTPSLIFVLYAKGYHDFPLKNFCLTVPKNFVEEPFCVSENFWIRKMLGIREEAGITIFRQKCFVLQYRIIRRGTLLCFRKIRVSKNFMRKR